MRIVVLLLFGICACQPAGQHQDSLYVLGSLPLDAIKNEPINEWQAPPVASGWVDILNLDSTISVDIRYATTNNFVGIQLYPCGRCILRPDVADALKAVHDILRQIGLGLKLYDCYRPWSVQKALWNKMPDARFVTPPEKGSMHNRGTAVDVTIIDEKGNELDMGTPYDFFGEEAYHTYTDLPEKLRFNRDLLKSQMLEAGFGHIRTEWWHYSYQRRLYELSDYQWPCLKKD
jgi:D-alanyl-D-alanine dipeptidase